MQRGRVLGHAIATIKHASLGGCRFLVVQPLGTRDRTDGDPILAVDTLGAGAGSVVLFTSDGKTARQMVKTDTTPLRYTTVGVEDATSQIKK